MHDLNGVPLHFGDHWARWRPRSTDFHSQGAVVGMELHLCQNMQEEGETKRSGRAAGIKHVYCTRGPFQCPMSMSHPNTRGAQGVS